MISYFGGVYGATTGSPISNVFVTNFPHTQNVTVTNFPKSPTSTQQTTAVDIEILTSVPGIHIAPSPENLTTSFAFNPRPTFLEATSALLTLEWSGTISQGNVGDRFAVQLNGQPPIISQPGLHQDTMLIVLPAMNVIAGANQINIYVIPVNPAVTSDYLLYEVRLTLQYNFNG